MQILALQLSPDLRPTKLVCIFVRFSGKKQMTKSKKTKKKTKRKLAHPKLPMQRQLNLRHEGTHFDLRPMFEALNKRYFRGRLRGYE